MSAQWDELRREARMLESSLEDKISSYTKLNTSLTRASFENHDVENPSPAFDAKQEHALALQIDTLISSLTEVKERMQTYVGASPSRSHEALLQRYREILFDFKTEFKKTQGAIGRKRESAELMAKRGGGGGREGESEMDTLLRERNAINSSQRMTDDIIGQAMATKADLSSQRAMFAGSASKMGGLAAQFPGLNNLIGTIQRRKKRDQVIIALVVAACLCFLIWLVLLR
jgi:Golgi SNAP receptor complex protein 1